MKSRMPSKTVKMNDSVYSENKTGFITGGKFSSDVKKYIKNQHDQLVTNNGSKTPFWVGQYNDSGAADAMGQTVYKVTYKFDGKSVDVYYMTEAEANKAIEEAIKEAEEENTSLIIFDPVAVKPTPSGGGGGGSGSYLPVILSPVRNQTVSVIEHGTLTMSVRASGASSYQWFVDRGDGRGFVPIAGATGTSLTIWPDMGDHGNRYYCQAKNGYGEVNSPYFTLCVVRSTLPPKTGDQVCVTLWVCLMALGVAGALTAWNRQKNDRQNMSGRHIFGMPAFLYLMLGFACAGCIRFPWLGGGKGDHLLGPGSCRAWDYLYIENMNIVKKLQKMLIPSHFTGIT